MSPFLKKHTSLPIKLLTEMPTNKLTHYLFLFFIIIIALKVIEIQN